ncbi:MAG: M20/M25/M40 family metallo-hydrolase [Gemmatimonadota bacterium]|jgi:acetylornithine deacetylase/succinyl-diaminopimelate desuccinylase-like protein
MNRWISRGAVSLIATLLLSGTAAAQNGPEVARAYRQAHEAAIVRNFAELLSFPNNASDTEDIRKTAGYIRDQLTTLGVDARLLELEPDIPPIVYGVVRVPGATRTLGLYVHYDGQPVDSTRWAHPPFDATLYTGAMEAGGKPRPMPRDGEAVDPEWRIYARSAGDDKAPIGALLPVLAAFRDSGVTPTSNLVFFFEGEEEAGSTHLEDYLNKYRDLIDPIDVWLFFDGPAHQSGRPQLTFGVRGVTGMEVTVYGPDRPLHSGHYGNWAPVPGQMLAQLLASMKRDDGQVLVDGFYDTVEPLGPEEKAALDAMPDYDAELKKELGLLWTEGEPQTLSQRLLLPSLTIRGLSSGNTGALARNVIPATATATLGIRLVKGNDPGHMQDLVEAHIRKQGYHIVREDPDMETRLTYPRIAKVVRFGGYPAARTSMANPFVQDVIAAAGAAADRQFGENSLVLAPALGGSLPLYLFSDTLKKPFVNVPVANHDDNQHAANENLRIANLWYAIELYAQLLTMPPHVMP